MEEDLGSQEALVAHVDGELLLADGVDAGVLLDPLGAVCVVLTELLHQIRTHVAEAFLQGRQKTQPMIHHLLTRISASERISIPGLHPATIYQ